MRDDERYSRQQDIVPPERIARCKATVIGVGAIGRHVALQLAAVGVPWLQLVDFDVIETSNLASQGYLETDLGRLKVEATEKTPGPHRNQIGIVKGRSPLTRGAGVPPDFPAFDGGDGINFLNFAHFKSSAENSALLRNWNR